MSSRRTKIIATLGPSTDDPKMIESLIKEGVNVFRLNLSHGSAGEHETTVQIIRKISNDLENYVTIIADIRGSKLRVGDLSNNGVFIKKNSEVIFDTLLKEYKDNKIPFYDARKIKIEKGMTMFLDDGALVMKVNKISGSEIYCNVIHGGTLFSRKGVNIPGVKHLPDKKKDKEDILFGKKIGVDYISLSFLRNKQDVEFARKLLKGSETKVIAKIESVQALEKLDEIVQSVDTVMIARGDLGLETPITELPIRQREIIEKCREYGVPVIVATQMLQSMTDSIIPTRAEVSDVASAVFGLADAVMLSGETATGKYPLEAVKIMKETVINAEQISWKDIITKRSDLAVNIAISQSACEIAKNVGAKQIIVGTSSGFSAKAISMCRPSVPIVAITDNKNVAQQLSIIWGIRPLYLSKSQNLDSSLESAKTILKKKDKLKKGDIIVYVSGIKFGEIGGTNMIKVLSV